jgi:hypothetical protein
MVEFEPYGLEFSKGLNGAGEYDLELSAWNIVIVAKPQITESATRQIKAMQAREAFFTLFTSFW